MLKSIAISLLVTALLLVLCEGGASLVVGAFDAGEVSNRPTVLERVHTEYDPELGWINLPSYFEPNMYGDGVYLRTNARRFRSDVETEAAVVAAKVRVICAGDSFTLGYGVANDEAWCSQLATLDSGVEAVNMGQGGYGIDQAYLWYKRDGLAIEHDVLIFAFISADFDRMMSSVYHGYGKPYFNVVDGKLEVSNVPVTQPALSKWAADVNNVLVNFRLYEFVARVSARLSGSARRTGEAEARTLAAVDLIMGEMSVHASADHVRIIWVFLPTTGNGEELARTASRRKFIREAAERNGVTFLDLVERAPTMFGGYFPLDPAHGHYSVAANAAVAEELVAFLRGSGVVSASAN